MAPNPRAQIPISAARETDGRAGKPNARWTRYNIEHGEELMLPARVRCSAALRLHVRVQFPRMDYVPTDPVHHPWLFRIGDDGPFGVPVFFLLSAFLITELLLRERGRTGRFHIKAFYIRRILRIWAALFCFGFFGLALLNHFVPGVGTADPLAWLAFTFFAGNWFIDSSRLDRWFG